MNHIAIIPDGNRRWAKRKNLPAWSGHFEGAKRVEEIVKTFPETNIKYLTIWGSSYDNFAKRSKQEIVALEKIYKELGLKILKSKEIERDGVKVQFIGEWRTTLNPSLVKLFEAVENKTRMNGKRILTLLICYNGDREMLSAVNKIVSSGKRTIAETDIKENLWTKNLSSVDLIIRTGGDPHLSNGFMMWDAQNSAIRFSEKMWPDFHKKDLLEILKRCEHTEKRLGA